MKYDREVTTITDILEALNKFDNKEEIIEAIKSGLYDIETDYHTEELFRQELEKYKAKEKELREYITSYESISIIQGLDNISKNKDLDGKTMIEMTNRYLEVHDKILDILDKE